MRQIARVDILFACLIIISVQLSTHHWTDPQSIQLSVYQRKLDRRIERFDTSGRTLIASVLDLAYENELPIGIEYVDRDSVSRPLDSMFSNQSVREILSGIVQQAPKYRISFSDGIVDIYAPGAREDSTNLLNKSIKDFEVTEVDTHKADFELFCALSREVLLQGGCSGSIAVGQWGSVKITVHLQNQRVYEILNAVVAQNGKAVWTVMAPPEKLAKIPAGGLWHIYPLEPPFRAAVLDKLTSITEPE